MKKSIVLKIALPLCTALIFGAGCVVSARGPAVGGGVEVSVDSEPPAPIVEAVPASPGDGYVWVGGAWAWHDRWVWERGHWDRPPHRGAVWVANTWTYHNGHRVFIHGHWR